MNKQERAMALLFGIALVGWFFYANQQNARRAMQREAAAVPGEVESVSQPEVAVAETLPPAEIKISVSEPTSYTPSLPEEIIRLQDERMELSVSSHGAVLKSATLKNYMIKPGDPAPDNPAVVLDFQSMPALETEGIPGLPRNAAYTVVKGDSENAVSFQYSTPDGVIILRTIELCDEYQIKVSDKWQNQGVNDLVIGTNTVALGTMVRGGSASDILSVDSLPAFDKSKVRYWDRDKMTRSYLVGSAVRGMGCGGSSSAYGMPERITIPILESQAWIAVKSRFFMTGFSASESNIGFLLSTARDMEKPNYVLKSVDTKACFPGVTLSSGAELTREYSIYMGPKKLALLTSLGNGMEAVMQFGTFTWLCKLLVPTLNFFYKLLPSYGVAIILLTILVRIIFWPLTHHSTRGMKKMQEIQPQLKEVQAKFKDNPQKLQQETWAVYRENKVNPLSSCLPMLIQIPVFIALFTVLRSAVELRYAPFLWIVDLSEPENLLAGVLPIPLNILPILMAGTMALQSYLTPSAGDPQQQRMMMIMMPLMMLFMFYNFPSALSLYWTVSQALSITQMWLMRRKSAAEKALAAGGVEVMQPMTRQQRRQAACDVEGSQ